MSEVTFNKYHIVNVLTFIVIPVRLGAASRTSVATPHIRIYGLVGGLLGANFRSYLFSKVVSLDLGLSWGVVIKPPPVWIGAGVSGCRIGCPADGDPSNSKGRP